MSRYIPEQQLSREKVDEHLQNLIEILGYETIVDHINRQFDVDTAAWFVEQLEKDYDIKQNNYAKKNFKKRSKPYSY